MTTGLAKARGLGVSRTDVERVMAHYGISREEAERWLRIHTAEELVGRRGGGFTRGTAAGVGNPTGSTGVFLVGGLVGAAVGGLLGAIIFSALHSR